MSEITGTSRPRLRRGVRLSYDKVRETHVLLFPEGVLVPNPTAAAVLEHCDGVNDVDAVVKLLSERYQGVSVADVAGLLAALIERRIVELAVADV
ncbi:MULTISPECIES: pyrroloquinoline quinone biosynthesis peptide chaperone PqqD [unclassified Crossiella]|uniref:pyrroloquinoline quinone biosynthesis peptide chaperone PqqD n=1 Tax=unclassified Crossiella TaxID=2620835 RepID=UPI001FFFC59A|nr:MULTISPECIES: pyrroloquinoline quinone biosynthesis peptide chaperone PqqD [unclassified Crossiella]MCK2237072.1 pyrroloquinoline quinone biosynthesis peptide chaperone PqqD [Crossiella sp. S99.2]MCK2250740.1 pyrroloquinoline quinone biosynthesis peptide chaperone PqqD [Crossiella sp. S99.1]